ncbi:MAG: molybdate ABC transporter substrate-binding protein [Spirochaetia bacterium]|nr:molybdate ABC transporter substrate-binding protein [Spirochaetia bacterium]
MKKWILFFCIYHITSAEDVGGKHINIAIAASVQRAGKELFTEFYKKTGVMVNAIYSSSGNAVAQIKNGAPYDIFISADTAYPEFLKRAGYCDSYKVYAKGYLVIGTKKYIKIDDGLKILLSDKIRKIAIPNPDFAPYGRAAMEVLRKKGILTLIKQKIVYAQNVSEAAQFIESGAVDIGFTARSVVLPEGKKNREKYLDVDSALYTPIQQGACAIKYGMENHPKESKLFMEYLLSPQSADILEKYGFSSPGA